MDKREPVEEYVSRVEDRVGASVRSKRWSGLSSRWQIPRGASSENPGGLLGKPRAMRLLTREEGAALWSDLEALDLLGKKRGGFSSRRE